MDDTPLILKSFPEFCVILNSENLLYAKANNQALAKAKGEWVLFLNPDTEFCEDSITPLLNRFGIFQHVGGLTCRLNFPDGRLQRFCRRFPHILFEMFLACSLEKRHPESALANGYHYGQWDFTGEMLIDQPPGAFLLVRRQLLLSLNGFDTRFPLFYNDVDLCRRIYQSGHVIWYSDETCLIHHQGGSLKHIPEKRHLEMYHSRLEYFKKHHPRWHKQLKYLSPLSAPPDQAFDLKEETRILVIGCCPDAQLELLINILRKEHPNLDLTILLNKSHPFIARHEQVPGITVVTHSSGFFYPETLSGTAKNTLSASLHVVIPVTSVDGFGYLNVIACLPLFFKGRITLVNVFNRSILIQNNFLILLRAKLIFSLARWLLILDKMMSLAPKNHITLFDQYHSDPQT